MCGIVGGLAQSNIQDILLEGLQRLEYRGYDSCGIAIINNCHLHRARSTERVAHLTQQVISEQLSGKIGIAHTRWATHGAPSTDNAHPIFSHDIIGVVHNGIIENYQILQKQLKDEGYIFKSQTDTEVIAHLVHSIYSKNNKNLIDAVKQSLLKLEGAYAIAVICAELPNQVIGARKGSPLVVGLTQDGRFIASDALAIAGNTHQFIFLEEGDIVLLEEESILIWDQKNVVVTREIKEIPTYGGAVELGPYRHFMQKEIFEQPRAIADTIPSIENLNINLFGKEAHQILPTTQRVLILACGTSYYSGLCAKYWLESIAQIPTQVEVASEYRYRISVSEENTLVIVISQSGETADTLAALKHAQSLGIKNSLAICNVESSAIVRLAQLTFLTRAGTEIGVASTKAFSTQLTALFLLSVILGKSRNIIDDATAFKYFEQLRHLPAAINAVLALEPQIIAWSDEFARKEHALFLGRGLHYPIALEGALKLKEISYIHAEAYPAGELKHGPLALVTEAMPVVTVAPNDILIEKLKTNMQEVRARGGQLYIFADADTHIKNEEGMHVIRMPEHYGVLSPILHVIPLQLLAYHTACARGTDVDKPRNLAKSVTVE